MSGAQKRKKIEQKLKDGKLPKLDNYFNKTVESTSENPTITTSVFEIPHENSKKNNVTKICQNINNTDDCDIMLSKNMKIICTKQYLTDIANYIQNSVLSVEDKHFITLYQKVDCVFHDQGFVIHWSSINVTANLVSFLELIVLSTQNGYEDLTIGPIHHEELKDMKNLYLIKWHAWLFINFKS